MPPHVGRLTKVDKFRGYYYSKKNGKFHKDHVSNLTQSNIIGFYDKGQRKQDKNLPSCRPTKFNLDYPDKWLAIQPFIKHISKLFFELIPDKYQSQYNIAKQVPKYTITDTPFSTMTINHNWQTALHKDKGDYEDGFGNLVVLEKGKYEGGYIGFPQFGIAINVRQGDFLAMDVHQWHANTDLELLSPDASRLSIVCYLRKDIIKCK
jgi:hypothetical protein